MPSSTFRRAAIAVALSVVSVVAFVAPAAAQLTIRARRAERVVNSGEKVLLGDLLQATGTICCQNIVYDASASPGISINGVEGNREFNVPLTFRGWEDATVTATRSGTVVLRVRSLNVSGRPVEARGQAEIKVNGPSVPPPQPAIIVPAESPPTLTAGDKIPLSKFLTTVPNASLFNNIVVVNFAFQATGGVQVNGLSGGALPPVFGIEAGATVTATSNGAINLTINLLASPVGVNAQLAYVVTAAVTVRFVAPSATTPPATSPPGSTVVDDSGPETDNSAPEAQSIELMVAVGAPTPVTLEATDSDGDTLTFTVVELPEHGKLSGRAPNLTYTPDAGFVGADAITFTSSDGTDSSEEATVAITVTNRRCTKSASRKVTVNGKIVTRKVCTRFA